jgi:UDP-N-acetyl-2-amino-2-deoxyglucuronate dehydrogenase
MSDKIKFAIVGIGHIGKRHAQVIQNTPDAELIGVADINPTVKLSESEFSHIPRYNSLENMLKSLPSADVINICTPNGEHALQTIMALEHGHHVVCEKPLALNKNDCLRILDKAGEVSRKVFCVMQNRYSPSAIWLKKIISEGILGKLNMVIINCLWNRDSKYYHSSKWRGSLNMDGGTLYTQFSHFIDTVYWLFGDITNIHSRFSNFNHQDMIEFEDSGMITFDFINGGSCSFNYTTSVWDKNFVSSITILGENGSVKVGGQYMNQVEYCHIKNYQMPELEVSKPANDYGFYKGSAANHEFVIRNVIDHLKDQKEITTSAYEGMKVIEIIERIYGAPAAHAVHQLEHSTTIRGR